MPAVLIVALIFSVAITAIGFVFHGFMWLAFTGITLFVLLAIYATWKMRHHPA